MKKAAGWILKIAGGLLVLILVLLFTIPALFKEKIRTGVEEIINESVNARVSFEDYRIGFLRNFPNLSFGLDGLSVAGTGIFEGDTLAELKSFDLVFNMASLFRKSGYEIKSLILDRARINALVNTDGSANWDIAKDTATVEEEEEEDTASALKLKLKKFAITNSSLHYTDKSSDMSAMVDEMNLNLSGDMDMSTTKLQLDLNIGALSFIMEDIAYLNKVAVDAGIDLDADLDSMIFFFGDNHLSVNDLKLIFSGMVGMPGEDIVTDLEFATANTSFKTLLSLVPAVYMQDYRELAASGKFNLSGNARGIYSEADSTLPDIKIDLQVQEGLISYPDLPERISNININASAFVDGTDPDGTTADVELFHFELAGNPFDMKIAVRNPVSDPDIKGAVKGRIDFSALKNALPADSVNLSGLLDLSVQMAGRLSMLENNQFDRFDASGSMTIKNMFVEMPDLPSVTINEADFEFSPAFAALTNSDIKVGEKSDFSISGRLENYIPYLFSDETIRGSLALRSGFTDVSDILSKIPSDTTVSNDTSSPVLIRIPENIDFDFNAAIDKFSYDKIEASNFRGHIIVRDGVLSLRETGMNMLGGMITLNAEYDPRDTLKPVMKADLNLKSIGVKQAFTSFNTIQKLAPAAENVDGKINVSLSYNSLLGSDMMPLVSTITGGGKLQSDEITLIKSVAYDKMKELLKLSDKYTNTFRDLNISFRMSEGRVYVSPFDTKVGNIKMNISGDQGLDQTMNYLIKTEIPRSELGGTVNSLIDNLSGIATSYGLAVKPADIMKINVRLTGVFGKPVVTPVFGDGTTKESPASDGGLVKGAAGEIVDEGKQKLRQEAEARGDELIREAEAKAQILREEAVAAAGKIREEANLQAQKLVDEAAARGAVAKLAAERAADRLRAEADKKASQLTDEANAKADQLIEEARTRKQELIDKI
ncbi:MAG TPA: AsmA-like C-terminal region-containing protein [Bacteroidales bacterium]|nr:AsmA-like C-terminal region-containing protein [Bacteroidales bacterium]HPR11271.1 AsmA-like C-terminal region-containing protein [Bacteroidales bacterium]HRW86743.1 AsmA-like C-terminal region-containing protein [Bacteroidales bacterium]